MTQPKDGFDDTAVYTMFHPPSPSFTVSASATATPKKSHTGAIVGGIVGGVTGLGIVAGLLLWRYRVAKRRNRPSTSQAEEPPERQELNTDNVRHELAHEKIMPPVEMTGDDGAKELPRGPLEGGNEIGGERPKLYEMLGDVPVRQDVGGKCSDIL